MAMLKAAQTQTKTVDKEQIENANPEKAIRLSFFFPSSVVREMDQYVMEQKLVKRGYSRTEFLEAAARHYLETLKEEKQ
jgi:metal-responsive CopG/Arc/MetJ family transcriptional regulator